jgi:hypothetical protein
MADIRLDRTDNYRIINRANGSNSFGDGLKLLPITCLRPCAMTLDIASLIEIKAC